MKNSMKARSNRSAPTHTITPTTVSNGHGSLNESKAAQWKTASASTYLELALNGALTPDQMRNAFDKGKINVAQFRKAFWKWFDPEGGLDAETLTTVRAFSTVLV